MGIDQKIENILGKLSVVLPNLENYERMVQENGREIAAVKEKVASETRNIYVRLKAMEDASRHDGGKASDRIWNLVTLLLSALIAYLLGKR